jgi:pilus assembly protein CpaF
LVRRLDLVNPVVDARLADGSRLCAVIPPVAARGTCLAVRKFAITPIPLGAFLDRSGVQLLQEIVHRRCNVLVSGPTSSGKTTLLNAITELVPDGERIVTIEDTSELQPRTSHVVGLESRPGNNEGLTEITASHLLRAALRLRPDRLVIGEIRGDEAVELVQAMNTGHDGTLATCHANSAEDALRRMEALIMRATNWNAEVVREHIRNSIDVVIHVARSVTGVRAVAHIAEVDRDARGSLRTRMIWCDSQQLVPLRNWR